MSLSSSYIVSFWGKEIHPFLFGSPPQSPCTSLWVGDWSGSLHQAWGADRWAVSPLPYLPAGLCLGWLGVALTHILICIYIYMKSIQIYFGIFFHFICVLLSCHCLHIISIFSEIFPIFVATLFTLKACHLDMALLILLPFRHPLSCIDFKLQN